MNDDKENNSNLYNVNNEKKDDNKNDEVSSFEPCYNEGNLGYPNKILNKDSNIQLDSNFENNYIDQSNSNKESPSDFEGKFKDRNSKKSKDVNNNLQTDIINNQIINTNLKILLFLQKKIIMRIEILKKMMKIIHNILDIKVKNYYELLN